MELRRGQRDKERDRDRRADREHLASQKGFCE